MFKRYIISYSLAKSKMTVFPWWHKFTSISLVYNEMKLREIYTL